MNADPRSRKDQRIITVRNLQEISISFLNSIEGVHQESVRRSFIGEEHRRKTVLTKCSTHMIWFERFEKGVELWVGYKSRTDQAISIELMKLLMENM